MAQISISTGKEEIEIVRDGEKVGCIYFAPGDAALISRLQEVREKASHIEFKETEEIDDALAQADAIDNELRGLIDYAFDYPCSDIVFGNSCTFTTENGVSALEQFLNGALAIIEPTLEKEAKASQKRMSKYTNKYK
ncbi:MAG: hypothetical protein KBS75_09370 [Bacteroidales bacterium]|nr:hypothetical protein [Candidatus Equimonas faecalis]